MQSMLDKYNPNHNYLTNLPPQLYQLINPLGYRL